MHTVSPVLHCVVPCVLSRPGPQQRIHGFEVMVTRKAEGKEGRAFIGSMTEEKSVELASKIASESFLFAVSHGVAACMGASQGRYCKCMGWHWTVVACRRHAAVVSTNQR